MRKSLMIVLSCVVASSIMTGAVSAKSENGKGAVTKEYAGDKSKSGAGKSKTDLKVVLEAEIEENATVTSVTYKEQKGHNGYKGLLNAINNVKDKPAGAVIADILLNKYETKLSAEMKAELEAIVEQDVALALVADFLEESGSVTDAVYVQKDAVRSNVKNLNAYKKLGKLYEKLGKKGLKLYVNGEEPTFEAAPFIQDGRTLVPFRAISEALKATVSWNPVERSVTVTRDGISVKLLIDSKTAYVDGKPVLLDVPAGIVKGNTVVPVAFISKALKAAVKWEAESKSVVIYEE
jgi:hypothetical protein